MVVGTHALFQDSVEYHDLALAVIDEQHRFGVDQRLLMGGKGALTDVLVMTATPIPRTLLLTQWGEMDVSRLTEKPRRSAADPHFAALTGDAAGRCWMRWRASWTKARRSTGSARWWRRARRSISLRRRNGFAVLRERFGDLRRIGAWPADRGVRDRHSGGVSPPGACRLLVATTVVEVGVDVPKRQCHGDRARRTLRAGAVTSAARPGGARRGGKFLPAAARGLGERRRRAAG